MVDQLPDDAWVRESARLALLYARTGDQFYLSLLTAPKDDEELSKDEAADIAADPVRLARHGRPTPLWLAWIGGQLPQDLHQLWRWYLRRFTVEHAFRFAKQQLGWTTVRPRQPAAADRWTWLVTAAFWQLWLARSVVADQRLAWERPLPSERLSPGRVHRAFGGLLATLGTPARAPQARGNSPGRRPGQRPGPAPRLLVARRPYPTAA